MVQAFLPGARLVKTRNHIGYHELETDYTPEGAADRRALAVADNDGDARSVVAAFIERLGYGAVEAGGPTGRS